MGVNGPDSVDENNGADVFDKVLPQKPVTRLTTRKRKYSSEKQDSTDDCAPSLAAGVPSDVETDADAQKPSTSNSYAGVPFRHSRETKVLFLRALQEHGKDFACISAYMVKHASQQRAECEKPLSVSQVRYFYYNSWNKLSARMAGTKYAAELAKDHSKEVREALETFAMINYFHWMRETNWTFATQNKLDKYKDSLDDLIMEGRCQTRLPVTRDPKSQKGQQKRHKLIRTPQCPALLKLIYTDCIDRSCESSAFPSDISVCLRPRTVSDRAFVLAREQNPLLLLKAKAHRTVKSILQHLAEKWRVAEKNSASSSTASLVALHPAQPIANPRLLRIRCRSTTTTLSYNSSGRSLCVNQLLTARTSDAENSTEMEAVAATPPSAVGVITLNQNVLVEGLSLVNSADLSVGQLYLLAKRESDLECKIDLLYDISSAQLNPRPSAYEIFTELARTEFQNLIHKPREMEQTGSRKKLYQGQSDSNAFKPPAGVRTATKPIPPSSFLVAGASSSAVRVEDHTRTVESRSMEFAKQLMTSRRGGGPRKTSVAQAADRKTKAAEVERPVDLENTGSARTAISTTQNTQRGPVASDSNFSLDCPIALVNPNFSPDSRSLHHRLVHPVPPHTASDGNTLHLLQSPTHSNHAIPAMPTFNILSNPSSGLTPFIHAGGDTDFTLDGNSILGLTGSSSNMARTDPVYLSMMEKLNSPEKRL